ncbi:enoyl-CoA hydratase/isomerase family protein [Devosia naphthalenivorans]|uniref:enoyl-CoA hydratase/isomerase family protein n=1 Tax=Devosia naphthalenivorans TaxID=2082392 RepID=UPI000D34427F|nr:enoyl-CoA hydratase/isomerase family protein [Devosia naphthalenivorans]
MTSDDVVLYDVQDGVAYIRLNRPEKLNAINGTMADTLRETWRRFEADPKVRVGVLSGSGTSFCAGRDISPGAVDPAIPFQTHHALPENGVQVFKPIVSAVHGYVLGAGYNLGVRSADITIAADTCLFGYPEGKAGIPVMPIEYTPHLPFKVSLEFALLGWKGGRLIDSSRAFQLGLANTVVQESEMLHEALTWAELLLEVPPLYIRSVKRGHYRAATTQAQLSRREHVDYVWPQEISDDVKEARAAFAERRAPKFNGK